MFIMDLLIPIIMILFGRAFLNGKRKKFNVYAKTKEECEEKLATMIAEKKAEIAAEKKKMKTA